MAFPLAPVNNQKSIQDGMTFIYVAAKTRWELYDDSDATQANLDSEYHARREADSDLQLQIWNNDSDIAYLNRWTIKFRGTLDVTKDLPSHTAVKAGDAYVVKTSGVVRAGWNGQSTKGVVAGDILMYTDSDTWIKVSGEAGVADSDHIVEVQSAYNYLISKNVAQNKIHFGKVTDTTFVEYDSDKYFLFEGSAGWGKPQMLDGVRSAANSMFVGLIGMGTKTTGARFDYYNANGVQKQITVGAGPAGTAVTYTNNGVNVTTHGDSEFQYMGFQFASNIAIGDYLVMTASGFKSIIKTFDGIGFKRVPQWKIALDSENHDWRAGDSDIKSLFNVVGNDVEVKKRVVSVNAGRFNLQTDAAWVPTVYTLLSGNSDAWITHNDGAGTQRSWIIVNGRAIDQWNDWTQTTRTVNGVTYTRGTATGLSGTVIVNGVLQFVQSTMYNFSYVDKNTHDLDYNLRTNRTRNEVDSDTANNFIRIVSNLTQIDSEFHAYKKKNDSDIRILFARTDSDNTTLQSLHTELELSLDSEELGRKRADSDLNNGKLTVVRRDSYSGAVTTSYNGGAAGTLWYRNGVGIGNCGAGNGGMPFFTGGFITLDAGQTQPITAVVATTQSSFAGESAGVYLYIIRNGNVVYQAKQEGRNLTNWDNTPKVVDDTTYIQATGPIRTTVGGPVIFWNYYDLSVTKPLFHVFEDSEYKTTTERDAVLSATIKNLWLHDFNIKSKIDSDLAILFDRTDSDNTTLQSLHTEMELSLDSEEHGRKAADSDIRVFFSNRLDSEYRLGLDKDSDLKVWISNRLDSEYRLGLDKDSDLKVWISNRLDSEYRHGLDHDSDILALLNTRTSLTMYTPATQPTTFVSVGGFANFSTGYASVLNVFGTTNMWLIVPTSLTGLASDRVLVVVNGAVKFYGDVASTATLSVKGSDDVWYFRGSSTDNSLQTGVTYGYRVNNVQTTTGNPYQVHYITRHKLLTTNVSGKTIPEFDSDVINNLEKLARFANEIDSEVHRIQEYWIDDRVVRYNQDSDIEVRGIFFNNDSEGYLKWNPVDFTLDLVIDGGVTLQLGQENVVFVRNESGRDMPNGTVVRVDGSSGAEIIANWAHNDSDGASANTIGITTQFIGDNNGGFVTTFGKVRGLNTSMWTPGDVLYLDSDGGMINVKPLSPFHLVTIGYVVRSHSQNGIIFVNPQNGYELNELHDVLITDPPEGGKHNQLIAWDSDNNYWRNISIDADFGEF